MTTTLTKIKTQILERPLAFVILVAVLLRAISVIWSHGFLHSDDYYDTVMIAYRWLNEGMFQQDGYLGWRHLGSAEIGRFPLYTLSLWTIMKVQSYLGVTSLETMMYTIRGLHALLSLAPVWVCYRIVEIITKDKRWALGAGLFVGANFIMPFLGVRTLIEIVGGNIWMLALFALYRFRSERIAYGALLAGLLTGLAWMIRFQIAFAALPIPFALWYQHKSLRPALWYSIGVAIMLTLSGFVDLYFLGEFGRSTIINLGINYGLAPLYEMSPLFYIAILLIFLIPPTSLVMIRWFFQPVLWKNHLPLLASSFCFLLCHAAVSNRQERFIFPIVTAFMTLAVLALWYRYQEKGYIIKSNPLRKSLIGAALLFNFSFLIFLTPAYSKKGLIEPVLEIKNLNPNASVLFVQPGLRYYIPFSYAAKTMRRQYIRDWPELETLRNSPNRKTAYDYIVIYPKYEDDLQMYLDSTISAIGQLELQFKIEPSGLDVFLHKLNPSHNPSFTAYIYKPVATDSK